MSQAQIEGAIRSIVVGLGGFAGAAGYLSNIDWVAVAGAMATIGGVIWSLWSNSRNQLLKQTAELSAVKQISVSPRSLADEIPSNKVVPLA
jgi:hypothetical protein